MNRLQGQWSGAFVGAAWMSCLFQRQELAITTLSARILNSEPSPGYTSSTELEDSVKDVDGFEIPYNFLTG